MDLQLTGKVALVTGSMAGITYAVAAALAREGAIVIVNGRTQSMRASVRCESRTSGRAKDPSPAHLSSRRAATIARTRIATAAHRYFLPLAAPTPPHALK
jgi:NAD(P)-dependent dehydrogenase (short-subunit alcohol dehydrogenase family)